MKTEKVILGKAINPKIKPIPHQCSKAKTIVQTFESIVFFKDTRLEAQNYVREVLPTLWLIDNCEEKSMNLYNSLGNRWLEFNTTTNLLYLCSINS